MDITERLESEDLELICGSLVAYVINRAKMMYGWHVDRNGLLPDSMSPVDMAYTAIKQTITGERTWNEERHPDLIMHLKSTVNSYLSNCYRSWTNRFVRRYEPEDLQRLPDRSHSGRLDGLVSRLIVEKMLETMVGEPELIEVIEAALGGYEKPAEIAEVIGVEPEEIYRRMRRIRSHTSKMKLEKEYQNLEKDLASHV